MKWDIRNINKKSWREKPLGGVIPDAGNAHNYNTGGWRAHRPVRDKEKCNDCLICFIFCPDSSVIVKDNKIVGFDLEHCKGCGICAEECPRKAIELVDEAKCKDE